MAVDDLIFGIDKALRTLFVAASTLRSVPGAGEAEADLSLEEKASAGALMRVNHVGEICAQALYQGQVLTCRDEEIRAALEKAGIPEPSSLIALQKPYMERRTLATLQAQWPEARVAVSSPPVTFRGYLTAELPQELVVSAMVGDFQRILEYPKQGFSTEQPVTPEAMQAFRTLVEAGYDSQLLKDVPLPWNS